MGHLTPDSAPYLMREAISLMREAISLMREAISLMREAISLMREAISLMREADNSPLSPAPSMEPPDDGKLGAPASRAWAVLDSSAVWVGWAGAASEGGGAVGSFVARGSCPKDGERSLLAAIACHALVILIALVIPSESWAIGKKALLPFAAPTARELHPAECSSRSTARGASGNGSPACSQAACLPTSVAAASMIR